MTNPKTATVNPKQAREIIKEAARCRGWVASPYIQRKAVRETRGLRGALRIIEALDDILWSYEERMKVGPRHA